MTGGEKRFPYTMLLLTLIISIVGVLTAVLGEGDGVVPLLGLPLETHILVTTFLWPVLGSILCAVLFPRLLVPLYLFLKKYIMPEFKDGEVQVDRTPATARTWLSRGLYVSLLVLGIEALLVGFFPFELLYTPAALLGYQGAGVDIRFTLSASGDMVGLLTPIAVGLLSVGWALEDSGLVHYDLPEEPNRLYEIEPTFRRYINYLKGYAGFSSVLFLFSIVFYFAVTIGPERYVDAVFTILLPLQAILFAALAYLTYVKVNSSFLRGRFPMVGRVSESDITG